MIKIIFKYLIKEIILRVLRINYKSFFAASDNEEQFNLSYLCFLSEIQVPFI